MPKFKFDPKMDQMDPDSCSKMLINAFKRDRAPSMDQIPKQPPKKNKKI